MRVRMAALDAVKCSGGGKAVLPILLKLADDPNPTIRFKAVNALASVHDEKTLEKLREIYESTPDIALKIAALKGRVAAGETVAPELLSGAFDSPSPEVKLEALKAMYLIPDTDAKRCFLAALSDESSAVRLEASLRILKRFGRPKSR